MDTGRQPNEKQLKLSGHPLLCMRLRQRLTSEAEDEREGRDQERRMEVQAEKARLECETMRMQHEMDMMRYDAAALAKSKGESDPDEDEPEKLRYDQIAVKMPRAPEVKNIVDGVSAEGRQGAVLTLVLAVRVHCLVLSCVLSYTALCCPTCYLWYPMLSCHKYGVRYSAIIEIP